MNTYQEMFEALLAGEELISIHNIYYKLIDGNLKCRNKDEANFKHIDFAPEPKNVRIKSKIIPINGIEVSEPLSFIPNNCNKYWLVDITNPLLVLQYTCTTTLREKEWIAKGLIHLTKEAAITHAKALLSFTEKK